MKAHIDQYRQMERAMPPRFAQLVKETPIETVREVAEGGLIWHLIHFRDRAAETLASPAALTSYAKARILLTRNVAVTERGPAFDANSLLAADLCFADAIRKGEKKGPSLHNRATIALQMNGDVRAAEPLLRAAIAEGHTDAYFPLGAIQANLGRGPTAQEELYRKGFPTDEPIAHYSMGAFLRDQGRVSEARPFMTDAIRYGMPAAHFNLAQLDEAEGNRESAVQNMVTAALYRVPQAFFELKKWGFTEAQIRNKIEEQRSIEDATA